jgi:hypothetical protein
VVDPLTNSSLRHELGAGIRPPGEKESMLGMVLHFGLIDLSRAHLTGQVMSLSLGLTDGAVVAFRPRTELQRPPGRVVSGQTQADG